MSDDDSLEALETLDSERIVETVKKMKNGMDKPYDSARTKSLGFVRTDDDRLAEIQLKVEADDWEWIDYETARVQHGWEKDQNE